MQAGVHPQKNKNKNPPNVHISFNTFTHKNVLLELVPLHNNLNISWDDLNDRQMVQKQCLYGINNSSKPFLTKTKQKL